MPHKLKCYTLFDITSTGVPNRAKPPTDSNPNLWLKQRNTQSNFDTILQAISLRSQPEITSMPVCKLIDFKTFKNFGNDFTEDGNYPCWSFEFEVQHTSVFSNETSELGALYTDCNGIPMIKSGDEFNKLPTFLNTDTKQKNIHFEKL